jgi:hypothetical protein
MARMLPAKAVTTRTVGPVAGAVHFALDSAGGRADEGAMTLPTKAALLAVLITALAGLVTGCGSDPTTQIEAATSSALDMSLRGLPAVTAATTTETKTPIDTLTISITTALDKASADDLTSATELLRGAAEMAYAARHDTVEAVTVTVYGVDSSATGIQASALLAQDTFKTSELAAGSQ